MSFLHKSILLIFFVFQLFCISNGYHIKRPYKTIPFQSNVITNMKSYHSKLDDCNSEFSKIKNKISINIFDSTYNKYEKLVFILLPLITAIPLFSLPIPSIAETVSFDPTKFQPVCHFSDFVYQFLKFIVGIIF